MNLRIDPGYSNRLRASLRTRGDGILAGIAVLLLLATGCGVVRAETDREYCDRQEGIAKTVCLRDLDKPASMSSKATTATPAATPATTPATSNSAAATPAAPGGAAPYKVVDGYHVDPNTYKGFQTWRAAACDRCHGPNQEGLVGPSLVNSLKTLSKDDFVKTVTNGRLEKGMPSFASNQTVISSIDSLYSYLKGRSDGAITKAHVEQIN
jgi:mono/diheme cytochrome c family protein